MLPKLDGWEVCRELRAASNVPILILSAKENEVDRVLGLSLGADDYVVKPFSPREVVARIKAILRRTRPDRPSDSRVLSHGGLVLDRHKRSVTVNGKRVAPTPSEYKLLEAMMAVPGKAFVRDELLNCLYPVGDPVIDRVVDVHVGKLRQKIEADPANPRYILTNRGVGYRFADDLTSR
jgi:DNA-binding response OmpR family regulator